MTTIRREVAAVICSAVLLLAGIGARTLSAAAPTFSKDVAPILYKNCAGCHRPGDIAPMSLLTYEEARPWAKAIRGQVAAGQMPPWHATQQQGTFLNDRRLSAADRETSHIWGLIPHTHLRGKSWEYRVVYPDGRAENVLSVPKYDFNWQTYYLFTKPLAVPKGTRLEATAHYDNSTKNASNPDPKVAVRWGDQTWEEMPYTGIAYSIDNARLPATSDEARKGQR
jgi:hypothetical protein